MMVMRRLVLGHTQPVHCRRRHGRLGIFIQNLLVEFLSIRPLLFHNRHARQPHQELCGELVFWKVTFNTEALLPIFIKDKDGWRPNRFKAPEPCWIFFDMNSNGDEVLFDERRELRVTV
jgi:hypothetical protein